MIDLGGVLALPVLSQQWKDAIEQRILAFFKGIIKIAEEDKQFQPEVAIIEHGQMKLLVFVDEVLDQRDMCDLVWSEYVIGQHPGAMFITDTETSFGDCLQLMINFADEPVPRVFFAPYTEIGDSIKFDPIIKADKVTPVALNTSTMVN